MVTAPEPEESQRNKLNVDLTPANRLEAFEELIEYCKLTCLKKPNAKPEDNSMDRGTISMAEKRLHQIIEQLAKLRQRFLEFESNSNAVEVRKVEC